MSKNATTQPLWIDGRFRTMPNGDIVYRTGWFGKEYIVNGEQKQKLTTSRKTVVSTCLLAGIATKNMSGLFSLVSMALVIIGYIFYFNKLSKSFTPSPYPKETFRQRTVRRYFAAPIFLTFLFLLLCIFFAFSCFYELFHMSEDELYLKWIFIGLCFLLMGVDCIINISVRIVQKNRAYSE